jgi:hypothetical protein
LGRWRVGDLAACTRRIQAKARPRGKSAIETFLKVEFNHMNDRINRPLTFFAEKKSVGLEIGIDVSSRSSEEFKWRPRAKASDVHKTKHAKKIRHSHSLPFTT